MNGAYSIYVDIDEPNSLQYAEISNATITCDALINRYVSGTGEIIQYTEEMRTEYNEELSLITANVYTAFATDRIEAVTFVINVTANGVLYHDQLLISNN